MTPIKGFSMTQPWGTLVALQAKMYETRSWRPVYRGPLAIQAAKGFPAGAQELCFEEPFYQVLKGAGFWQPVPGRNGHELVVPRGAIIAVVDLVECLSTWSPLNLSDQEKAFGDFSPGRWAWRFENVRALPEPVPVRGYQFLWDLEPDVVEAIEHQLGGVHV